MTKFFKTPDRRDVLANLPTDQRARLEQWLLDGVSYEEIARLIAQPAPTGFGIQASKDAVGRYYRKSKLAAQLADVDDTIQSLPHPETSLKNLLHQSALTTGLQTELPPATFQILARYYRHLTLEQFKQRSLEQRDLSLQLARDRHNLETFKAQYIAAREALNHFAELAVIYNDQTLDDPAKIELARTKLFGAAAIPAPAPSNLLPPKS
jgi:hypothetical protein